MEPRECPARKVSFAVQLPFAAATAASTAPFSGAQMPGPLHWMMQRRWNTAGMTCGARYRYHEDTKRTLSVESRRTLESGGVETQGLGPQCQMQILPFSSGEKGGPRGTTVRLIPFAAAWIALPVGA